MDKSAEKLWQFMKISANDGKSVKYDQSGKRTALQMIFQGETNFSQLRLKPGW